MSRRGAVLAAVLGCVALVLGILIVGRLTTDGATAPPVLASGPSAAPPTQATGAAATTVPAAGSCAMGAASGTSSAISLSGACTGELTGTFGCVAAVDDLYLTGRRQLDASHVLYLTINIESYRQHPGDYDGAQAVLQLTGPVTVERWSNYGVGVHVHADRSVTVPSTELGADPGTGSSGAVTVSGSIGCAA
jgi:hypothetical protein